MNEYVAIAIAAIGVIISWGIGRVQNRDAAATAVAEWRRDVRSWAEQAIDVLAEAIYTSDDGDLQTTLEREARATRLRWLLSSLIDRGRFFLPNEREGDHGVHKPPAFRGLRHSALDPLVAAERILAGSIDIQPFPNDRSALDGVRREFVSSLQSILDPRGQNREIARMQHVIGRARKADPTLGGLLPDAKKAPTGAEGIIIIAGQRYLREQERNRGR